MKVDLSKEVVSDEVEVSMGHTTFVTSKAGLMKEVVFHEDGLSKGVLLCMDHLSACSDQDNLVP